MEFNAPEEIKEIIAKLKKGGFQAYIVGGCVRDMLHEKMPKDWDVTTDARPENILELFPDSVYENNFGTVGVKTRSEDPTLKIVEITPFRMEGKYSDKRHPDQVRFASSIKEDLERRDFTINALAWSDGELIDMFGGQEDLKKKIIRTVGNPHERFDEDALRLMRAVRFAAELNFTIEEKTAAAIKKNARHLEIIAKERIRDEFVKIIMAPHAMKGIQELENLGLLPFIIPELREGIDVGQNKHHIYTVWEHNLRALDYTAKKDYSLEVRLASLLHDVGKPQVKQGDGSNSTFYAHEIVGGKMTLKILDRLRFSKETIEYVTHLVRYHLFYYNVGEVTEAGVRRFLQRVGPENVADLMKVREADRIGSGVPKAVPYKLRHLLFMIEKVKSDPIGPQMLSLRGDDVMKILGIPPGPKVGQILSILLEEVLDDPKKNTDEYLGSRAKKLGELSEKELRTLTEKAKNKKNEFEEGIQDEMKEKYHVK